MLVCCDRQREAYASCRIGERPAELFRWMGRVCDEVVAGLLAVGSSPWPLPAALGLEGDEGSHGERTHWRL